MQELPLTPRLGQNGAAAKRLLNSLARALQVNSKTGNAQGLMSLLSDPVVEWRVGAEWGLGLILDARAGVQLELTWASWAAWAPG